MTSTETTETAYDWLLEIFDSQDGWRTWAHDWNDTNPAGPGTLAQQLVDKHCEHLNRDWRIHIWPATGEYRHTNKPIHELTGVPKPVDQRRRTEPRICDALCRDVEKDRDQLVNLLAEQRDLTEANGNLHANAEYHLARARDALNHIGDVAYRFGHPADINTVADAMTAIQQAAKEAAQASPYGTGNPIYLVWSHDAEAWWGPNNSRYHQDDREAGRYTAEDAAKACNARTWELGTIPPEVAIICPSVAELGRPGARNLLRKLIDEATRARIAERDQNQQVKA